MRGNMDKRTGNPERRSHRRLTQKEKERMRLRRRRKIIRKAIFLGILAAILLVAIFVATALIKKHQAKELQNKAALESQITAEENALKEKRALIAEADELAAQYDYDGAIDLLKNMENSDTDTEIIDAIAKYTAVKSTLETVDATSVPHIFFHSLIVDTDRAFDSNKWSSDEIAGINAWMTTVEEFDKIIQQMYDNGYVLVRLRDLVTETKNDDGTVTFTENKNLKLPAGKKAYVLSIDDWSYYHSYDGKGYADKAVLDENGDVKCQYTDADGNVSIGDYDVVPRLNTFLEEHPDGCYKGARGLIAMTGYNGVFGYRTDVAYKTHENLGSDQKAFLDANPDFNWDDEVAMATKIADACKEEGWEFACHTWGHLSVTGLSVDTLKTDQEKWQNTVANITGPTDTIIFAHGNDIGDWHPYDEATNSVYAYFKSVGYNFYCNVDASTPAWVQINSTNVRQGRIDCDGLQMWRALAGEAKINVFEDLFDVQSVFDSARPTPVSATGKS